MAPSRRAECALAASRTVNLQFGRRVEIAVQSPHAHKTGRDAYSGRRCYLYIPRAPLCHSTQFIGTNNGVVPNADVQNLERKCISDHPTPEGAFLDPRWTPISSKACTASIEYWPLRMSSGAGRLSTFVRTGPRSRIQGYLQSRFGPVQAEKKLDWLSLHWSEDAYVCTLHLNGHALLPTAGYTAGK